MELAKRDSDLFFVRHTYGPNSSVKDSSQLQTLYSLTLDSAVQPAGQTWNWSAPSEACFYDCLWSRHKERLGHLRVSRWGRSCTYSSLRFRIIQRNEMEIWVHKIGVEAWMSYNAPVGSPVSGLWLAAVKTTATYIPFAFIRVHKRFRRSLCLI